MNRLDEFDLELSAALADLAVPAVPDYFDDVLAVTQRTTQRPAWTFPERWLPMTALADRMRVVPLGMPRPAALLLLLALLIAALVAAYVGSRERTPAPFGLAANGAVAFVSAGDVWIGDPVAGGSRVLVGGAANDTRPAWSLDGRRLAFIRTGETLVVVDADGRPTVDLREHRFLDASTPAWSPDGRTIAIEHQTGATRAVSILDVDGGAAPRTLDLGFVASAPAWRPPDGRELLVRGVSSSGSVDLYVVAADGSAARPLHLQSAGIAPDRELLGASWSPDGSRILYGGLEFVDATGTSRYRSHVVAADGTGDRVIEAPEDRSDVWPRWAPDGRRILFERVLGEYFLGDDDRVWLAIADMNGGPVVEVSSLVATEGFGAIWSPDATRIVAHAASTNRVYLIDPVTGAATEQAWSADGEVAWQRR